MQHVDQKSFDYASIPTGYYDDIFRREKGAQSAWHHLKFSTVRAAMPPHYRDHLDIGCGAGTFISTLAPERRSTGVDIAEAQIEYAKQHYGTESHRFICIDAMKELPFSENAFDVVTMVEIIEHLPMTENRRLLEEALRVLRPGGRIVLTTPNYASFWPILESIVNRLGDVSYEDQHISPFNRGKLTRLLEDAGFGRISVSTFQGLSPFLAAVSWNGARRTHRLEGRFLRAGMGFLLLGQGEKPAAQAEATLP